MRFTRWPIIRASFFVLAAVFLPGVHAAAAPFCVEGLGLPRQCLYTNTQDCLNRAAQLRVNCTVNPDEIKVTGGYGAFCTVDSQRVVQCLYPDVSTCNKEALKSGAICVINSDKTIETDPFRYSPDRIQE